MQSRKTKILLVPGAIARPTSIVGQGTGAIFYDFVRCTGSERRLHDCPRSDLEVNSCSHSHDVGVTCVPGTYITYYISIL